MCSGLLVLLMGLILVVVYSLIIGLLRGIYEFVEGLIIVQGTTKVLTCMVEELVNTGPTHMNITSRVKMGGLPSDSKL